MELANLSNSFPIFYYFYLTLYQLYLFIIISFKMKHVLHQFLNQKVIQREIKSTRHSYIQVRNKSDKAVA